jgi:hypothetical protein
MSGSLGNREVLIIIGKTRYGKSTWNGKFLEHKNRKFTFDPFRKYIAEYLDSDQIISRFESGVFKQGNFNIGMYKPDDLPIIGSIAYLTGNCYLTIEECGIAFYKGERIDEWLQEAIFLGGHQSLSIVLVAQRAASIPIELRSQATRFVSFLQTEKNDVRWCEDYLQDRFHELNTLARFECLDAEDNSVSRYFCFPPSITAPIRQ